MTLGSATSDVNMINIAVSAADGSGMVWQDAAQMIPKGMNGNPEAFVAAIQTGLPLVNTLRVLFNEYSFNADGSMNPQFERFLAAAAAAGYQVTLAYGGGDAQNIGIGDADHPALTNAQAMTALQDNFTDISGAWSQMMTWMDGHAAVANAVYGYDLINEAAGYRHSVAANGTQGDLSAQDFVQLYAEHIAALAQLVQNSAEGHILVGGWGYNGDFLTLASQQINGQSVLDYIRAAVGPDLVWSAHLYPGWMGTNIVTTPAELVARLDAIYAPLDGDNVLVTEINIVGTVDDPTGDTDYTDLFAASFEWFADNGVGLGWFPGVMEGSSHLLYIEGDASISYRHQHSLAHALNAYSLGEVSVLHAGDERLSVVIVDAGLRNETYEINNGEPTFDLITSLGSAFGYEGNDTLRGTDTSNDFLYGGTGNDAIYGQRGDDFLFGQDGDDLLNGGAGDDQLFGGRGDDTLNGGAHTKLLDGGEGDDTYIVTSRDDVVNEYAGNGSDTILTTVNVMSLSSGRNTQYANVENLTFIGSGAFRGTGNALDNRITGGDGGNVLIGLGGRDVLVGNDGDDSLSGSFGNDVLSGGAGADVLDGGRGADVFVFASGGGDDIVTDFTDNIDTISLRGLGLASTAEAMDHARQVGADVVFDFGPGLTLTLQDAVLAQFGNDITLI